MAVSTLAALATAGTQWAVTAGFTLAMAVKTFAISFALSAVSRALAPKPQGNTATGLSSTVKSPTQARPIIYGKTRTAGTLLYIQTTGDDSKYLHMVQAIAGHEIDGYEKIYIDDELAWDNGTIQLKFTGKIRLNLYTGNQTTADSDLVSESSEWTNTCILNDTAYIYIRLEYDAETFNNGIPNITALVRGKKVHNPVTDVTEWTQNPALCIADYINDSKYGLTGISIDSTALAESVGVCAQQVDFENESGQTQQHDRYQINGYIDTSEKVSSNIENMLSCMFGEVVYSQGKLHIKAGYYKEPVLDIDESVIVGDITLQTKQSKRSQYNGVKGVFLSSEENYTLADYPAQLSSAYVLEDGEPNYLDMTLPFTTDNIRAQRLAKLALGKSRQQRVITVPVNLVGLKIKAGDNIRINNTKLGLANAVYQVVDYELDFSEQLKVNLVCIETGASLYDWTIADQQDFSVASDVQLWDGSAKPPTALNATSTTEILTDGTTSVHIDVSWTAPDDVYFDYYVLKFGNSSITTKDTSYRINNVDQSGTYAIEVSAYNNRGRKSSVIATTVNTSPDTTAPSDITPRSISSALQSISLTWTNPTDDDFDLVRIKVADTNAEPTTHKFEVRSDSFVHDIGAYSTTQHYWLAPVDRTGNVGNYVSGGTATTGSIAIGDVPSVAGTFYLTIANDNVITDAKFLAAVGRNPIKGDVVVLNKEYFFTRGLSAWAAVTEFIDGSLLVTDSITATSLSTISADLGDITGGSIDIGSGTFTVDSDGNLTGTSVNLTGDITAQTLTLTGAQVTDSRNASSLILSSSQLDQSVVNLIDQRIEGYGLASSGDFKEDTGGFNNTVPSHAVLENFNHLNGKDVVIELSASSTWSGIGSPTYPPQYPNNDSSLVIEIQRRVSTETDWTNAVVVDTITNGTSLNTVITGGTWVYGYSSVWFNGLTINYTFNDDPATGTYDYRAFIKTIGSNYTGVSTFYFEANEAGTASGGGVNNYADSFSIADATGIMTIGRNGLTDLTADISTYVGNQVSALVDSAPATLDTLNELAAALGDDANFAQTTATALGTKMPTAGGTFTGTVKLDDELQFTRGSSDYSNYIRAANYPSQGFTSDANKYWLEYGAKGGHHFVVNTDGGAGAPENDADDFTIWQGAVDGDRLLSVSNVGNVDIAGTLSASGYNNTNWDTAHGWGNHATQGYLTSLPSHNHDDRYYTESESDSRFARVYKGTATINASYTTVATVSGNGLASSIDMTIQGTSNGVVINVDAKILVNHYQDILIKTESGIYVQIQIKVTSNNNESYAIEIARVGGSGDTSVAIEIFPRNSETVTFTGSHSFTGSSLNHQTYVGTKQTATGGGAYHLVTDGNISSQTYEIDGTTVINSSRNITNIGNISASNINLAANPALDWSSNNITLKSRDSIGVIKVAGNGTYNTRIDITNATDTETVGRIDPNSSSFLNGDFNLSTGSLQIGGTTVIDSSRNISNVGTISLAGTSSRPMFIGQDGSITTKGNSGSWSQGFLYYGSSNTYRGGFGAFGSGDALDYFWIGSEYNNGSNFRFYADGTFNIGGTTVIDSSRNLTNIASYALPSNGGNNFITTGTGDGGTIATHNFRITGWNGMGMYNSTVGGTYPTQTTGVYDFREGQWDTLGGYQVNGTTFIDSSRNLINIGTISKTLVTASEGREIESYMPASYTVNSIVSGHRYGWYNDNWYIGMCRSGSVAGEDFGFDYNGSRKFGITKTGDVKVNGTTVIDSNRNATFVDGTFTGDLYVNSGYSGNNYLRIFKSASGDGGILFATDSTFNWQNVQTSTGLNWYSYSDGSTVVSIKNDGTLTAKRGYQVNGTTVIDSSRNLTNIANVSESGGGSKILKTASNGYLQLSNWINIGSSGLYSTTTNGAHWYPNASGSFGVWRINGSKSGYSGIFHDNGGDVTSGMYDSLGNGGDYNASTGWHYYYHRGNDCLGISGSSTSSSYGAYVDGGLYSTGNIVAYSDRRKKENIVTVDSALEKVNLLRGVYYNRIDDETKTRQLGVIAQETEQVIPEAVTYAEDVDEYGVQYGNLAGVFIEAIKELTQQVNELKQEIEVLKNGTNSN